MIKVWCHNSLRDHPSLYNYDTTRRDKLRRTPLFAIANDWAYNAGHAYCVVAAQRDRDSVRP